MMMSKLKCEGWRREGGAFTLGRPIWTQCKNDPIVMLKVKGNDKYMPSCSDCWQETIDDKDQHPIKSKPMPKLKAKK